MEYRPDGGAYLQKLIYDAKANGLSRVTISGNWEIEKTVFLPADFTLILADAHLRLKDNSFCPMFRNAGYRDGEENCLSDADCNITVRGDGIAILDGGEYNGLSEANSEKKGIPIYQNNLILFVNVDGFRIEGLQLKRQRWWAIDLLHCRNGILRDLNFEADDRRILPDGTLAHGLRHGDNSSVYVKNADGIDLRVGCHNILIEDISGFTEDDMVALTALNWKLEKTFAVKDSPLEIRNVIVRNVHASAYCSMIRLLNQGGTRIHDILIDGVMDCSAETDQMDYPSGYGVRVGDSFCYGGRSSAKEETARITVRNIWSRGRAALSLWGEMTDCVFENIYMMNENNPVSEGENIQYKTKNRV